MTIKNECLCVKNTIDRFLKNACILGSLLYVFLAFALISSSLQTALHVEDIVRLLQIHLLLSGVFLFRAARTREASEAGRPLFYIFAGMAVRGIGWGFVLINGFLGLKAMIRLDPQYFWIIGMGLPAYFYLIRVVIEGEDEEDDDDQEELEQNAEANLTPDVFLFDPLGVFLDNFRTAVATSFLLPVTCLILWAGFFDYEVMSSNLFGGQSVDPAQALSDAFKSMANLWYILIPAIAVLSSVFLLIGGVSGIVQYVERRSAVDANRNLSPTEISVIERALTLIVDYKSQTNFPKSYPVIVIVIVCLMIGLLMLGLAVPMLGEIAIEDARKQALEATIEILVYQEGLPYSAIPGLFLGVLTFWSATQWLTSKRPRFAAYMFAKRGWNSSTDEERNNVQLAEAITHLVRIGKYRPTDTMTAEELLLLCFKQRDWFIYRSFFVFAFLTSVVFYLDVHSYSYADTKGMTFSRYHHLDTEHIRYADLSHVDLKCFLYKKDGAGIRRLNLEYRTVTRSGVWLDILTDMKVSRPETIDLSVVEGIHHQITQAKVPVRHAKRSIIFLPGEPGFREDCMDLVEEKLPTDLAIRVAKIWGQTYD